MGYYYQLNHHSGKCLQAQSLKQYRGKVECEKYGLFPLDFSLCFSIQVLLSIVVDGCISGMFYGSSETA